METATNTLSIAKFCIGLNKPQTIILSLAFLSSLLHYFQVELIDGARIIIGTLTFLTDATYILAHTNL